MKEKPILEVLHGHRPAVPPLWMMRQAGRYLQEYRALRAQAGGFLNMVYDPEVAAEITLQPLRRFPLDAAILFSDILIVPHAMGQKLTFSPGQGPLLSPPLSDIWLDTLTPDLSRYEQIYATVRQVAAALPPSVTFLGFAGSPWTVATYMVAGQGSKDQSAARLMAYAQPERFSALIDALVSHTVDYLCGQIRAGVDAVQLFDSWAGSLAPDQFDRWVIAPTAAIVQALKARHPDVPVIGFPKGAGAKLAAYAAGTGVDALGLDETIDPVWANTVLPAGLPVQGNLDPLVLRAGGPPLVQAVGRITQALAGRPHIFNLGHGIAPDVPIAHVEQMIAALLGPGPHAPALSGGVIGLGSGAPAGDEDFTI